MKQANGYFVKEAKDWIPYLHSQGIANRDVRPTTTMDYQNGLPRWIYLNGLLNEIPLITNLEKKNS